MLAVRRQYPIIMMQLSRKKWMKNGSEKKVETEIWIQEKSWSLFESVVSILINIGLEIKQNSKL